MAKKKNTYAPPDDIDEMPKEANELTKKWTKRFKAAVRYQKDNTGQWGENERLMYGRLGDAVSDYDIAIGFGLCQFLISQIYYQNPEVLIMSKAQMGREVAKFLTQIVQYDSEEMDLKASGHLCLADCFANGYGILMEDYDFDLVDLTSEEEKAKKKVDQAPADLDYKDQRYAFRRIPPKDFIKDPDGIELDLSDSKWAAVAYYPTITELQTNKEKYPWLPKDINSSKASSPSDQKNDETQNNIDRYGEDDDPDFKQIKCWEIWVQKYGDTPPTVYYFADDKKRILGKAEWPVTFDRSGRKLYPMTPIAIFRQGKSWYPIPVLTLIAPQIRNISRIQKYFIKDLTTKIRKMFAFEGLVPPDKLAKITDTSSDDVTFIELANSGLDELVEGPHPYPNINELIGQIPDIQVNKDFIGGFGVLWQQIQQIIGFADTNRGGLPSTRSAREAMAIKDVQNKRISAMADPVGMFFRAVMEKHIQCLQQTAVVSRYVKIADNPQMMQAFKEYTKDDIGGKFFFDVFTGSSMPKDTDAAKQQFVQFMQMFVPFLQKEGYSIAPIVYQAAEMYHIRDVDDFFRNQKQAARMVAQIIAAVSQGSEFAQKMGVKPESLVEASSALVSAVLTKEETRRAGQEVMSQAQGGGSGPDAGPKGQRGESNASQGAV